MNVAFPYAQALHVLTVLTVLTVCLPLIPAVDHLCTVDLLHRFHAFFRFSYCRNLTVYRAWMLKWVG